MYKLTLINKANIFDKRNIGEFKTVGSAINEAFAYIFCYGEKNCTELTTDYINAAVGVFIYQSEQWFVKIVEE